MFLCFCVFVFLRFCVVHYHMQRGEWINIEPVEPDTSKWFWGVGSWECSQPNGGGDDVQMCIFISVYMKWVHTICAL